MFKIISILLLCAIYFIANIDAHGRMMEPPSRGSVWRLPEGKGFPIAEYDNEWCGYNDDPNDKRNKRDTRCGVCGPVYHGDPAATIEIYKGNFGEYTNLTSYERGSKMYKGDIVRTYKKGQWVTAKLKVSECFSQNS